MRLRAREALFRAADRFRPPGVTSPAEIQRLRVAVVQSWVGLVFTLLFVVVIGGLGTAWTGAGLVPVSVGCLIAPWLLRRGVGLTGIVAVVSGLTWLSTFFVVSRSGGFESPAMAWSLLLPLAAHGTTGPRWVVVWSLLAAAQLSLFAVLALLGVQFPQDFGATALVVLRFSAFAGVVISTLLLLTVAEATRTQAQEALERERKAEERASLMRDMHDGLGSQLLGLLGQLRAAPMAHQHIVDSVQQSIDDLRCLLGALDPHGASLADGLSDVRSRFEPRCDAASVTLSWSVAPAAGLVLPTREGLHVLRALQELLSNALRHAQAPRIDVEFERSSDGFELAVRDHGQGFDPATLPRQGRGLASLDARARALGGTLVIEPASPGTRVRLRVPLREPQR